MYYRHEWPLGEDQLMVVYVSDDTGNEVDAVAFYDEIATDAQRYVDDGFAITSVAAVPLRHAGTVFGQEGSGYQTKISATVIFSRST